MSDFMNKNGHICDVGCEGLREEVGCRCSGIYTKTGNFWGSNIQIDATTSTWKTGNFRGSNIQIDAMILDENWIM